jgi:hypothetical protein
MTDFFWGAATELSNIAGAAMDNLSPGGVATLGDIDNTTSRKFYCLFRINLGSINPTGAPSLGVRIFQKIGGVAPDRSATIFSGESRQIPMLTGAGARAYNSPVFWLQGPFLFGVEIVNNTTINLAASGNAVVPWVWAEAAP